jgi:CBS domain-containing protein
MDEKRTVREAMTRGPSAIGADATVVEAARIMSSENVGSLPVVEGDRLLGMVTDRDLVLQVVARDLDANKVAVADVCSGDPVVATPHEPLDQALQRMAEEQVRRLPVVSDGRLVGILAQADVARAARPESTGRMVEGISADAAR